METWKDTVAMLLAAVEIEQEAVLQRPARSSDTVRADRVERVTDSNGTVRYHLRTSQWPSAWSDAVEIRATAPSPWVAAEAVTVAPSADARHFDIDLDVASPLPASTASLEVRSDDAGVLRMLARKLGSIGAEDSPIQPRLAMAATMPGGQTKIGRDKSAADLVVSKTANIPQRRAVEQSLGSELTFIWGPPGTGKSDIVANIIVGYRRRGWRVLFVAPTHLAVDQALLRVCDQLVGDPVFHEGLVQRKNGSRLPALTSRFGDQIDAAATLARLQRPLRAHSRRLAAEISTVAAATELLREAARLDQTVRASRTEEQRLTAELAQRHREEQWSQTDVARATTTLAEARQASAPWKRRRVPRLQAALEEAGRAHDTASLRLRQGVDARRLAGERAEIAAGALAKLTGLDALGTLTIQALDLDRRRLEEEREGVDSALMQLPEHVAQNCLITATTVAGASTGRHDVNGYDVVVVDEAGMVDRASAFVVTGLARRAVVLAGDFRQLPAVVSAVGLKSIPVEKQRLAAEWMAKDVFLASGVVNSAGLVTADPRLVTLSEQYRMRRAICDLVNDVAYRDAPLVTGRGEVSAVSDCSLLAGPVVLIDSSGSQVSGRGPTRNIAHAAIIRELIRGLQYADVLPPRRNEDSDPPSSVGIVCPYNQQKTLLNRVVLERFGERYQLADTVHRFQGSQRPVIVLDTVAGAADSLGQFWDKVGLTSTTCRLLNVAMSRAQDHLVIVANVDFLEEKLPAGSEVRRMLTWLQERAARLSVDTLVPTRSAAALATLDPTQLARPAFFPADEVAAAVTFDIDHATTRVDLFCPFIRPRTVHDVLPHLRRAVDRGVRVRAMVRPFEPGGTEANACDELRGAGCEVVDHREVAHEKVLIVDDILWHGSFNLLAHYRSTELMMRMVDTESIAEVVQILDRARPTSYARPDTRAQATVAGPDEVAHRCYLRVPYREKDDAKALGARWDTARRQWYFDTRSHEGDTFSRWMS